MCGIVALLNYNYAENFLTPLAHRGPDNQGFWRDSHIQMGEARLAIQDVTDKGNQPMVSSDGRYILIFNGEIYNHEKLRDELKDLDYKFNSTSDTETLLYALCHWGKAVLPRLNGIFAFCFYDSQLNKLLVARDSMGVKPLYYYTLGASVIFSSEIKAMLPFAPELTLDTMRIKDYLSFLYCPGAGTPVKEIEKVLPGDYSEIEVAKLSSFDKIQWNQFLKVKPTGKYRAFNTEAEAIDALDEKLQAAVKRQLLSDVPIGYFLSGGLDSSLLVAMVKKLTNEKLTCFTIKTDFDVSEDFVNDLPYAKMVANYLDVDLEVLEADIDIVNNFDKMIWHLDEPQADAAPLNVYAISKRARELGFKVLIGGVGADDLFSGYRRHQMIQFEKLSKLFPAIFHRVISPKLLNGDKPLFRKIKKVLFEFDKPIEKRLANYHIWLPAARINYLLSRQLDSKTFIEYKPSQILIDKLDEIQNEKSWINRMLYWETNYFLPDHNLNYTDKMGMAHGVEIRVPYLDNEVVRFANELNPRLKVNGNTTKYILRKVAERYLPTEVIYRSKTGFGAPVRKWIKEDLDTMVKERLHPVSLEKIGLFNPDEVWKLIHENKKGKVDASYPIWCLLAIESWVRQFMNQELAAIPTR